MKIAIEGGFFITLEGGEGTGKSTQIKLLQTYFEDAGYHVVATREPGGSAGAERLRDLLLHSDTDSWSPRAEALLFAAARCDHVDKVIRPALAEGKLVLCDRYIDSTLAYQGGAGGVSADALTMLNLFGTEGLWPDLTLLLTVPPEETARRLLARDAGKSDTIGGRGADYHHQVSKAFVALSAAYRQRYRTIAANDTIDTVSSRIIGVIQNELINRTHTYT